MNYLRHFAVLILLSIVVSCTKDFIVKDIKKAQVSVIAPANNLKTAQNSITFWWDELDGADKYSIQVVKPSFASVQTLVADTNVTGTKFVCTLAPGTYQWRIRGVNNGGNSLYTIYNLTVDTTANLAAQLIIPINPVSNSLTGNKTMTFSWNANLSATNYEVFIEKISGASTVTVKDTTTANASLTTSFAAEGNYQWKIRAFNTSSISQYNTPLTFTIDLTAPGNPSLLSPAHGATVKDTIYLKWTRASSTSTITGARYDSLYVYNDSALSSVASSAQVYSTQLKIQNLVPSISPVSTYYWWRVKSIDSVGNRSGFSNSLKFKLN
ncbi:MAG: hypothetical protein ACXVPQ_05040 [Bacteroidia bacterium]